MLSLRLYMKTYFFGFSLSLCHLTYSYFYIWGRLSTCLTALRPAIFTLRQCLSDPGIQYPTKHQILSFLISLFPTNTCFHLRTSAHALPVFVIISPNIPLTHGGHLISFRYLCHFYRVNNLRPHYLVGLSTILYHCTLFVFFTASPTTYNYISAGLFYHVTSTDKSICSMRIGDLSISLTIAVPALRTILGTQTLQKYLLNE